MSDQSRKIELQVEVAGTPKSVWRAIATGPGISSWYVPHQVEERDGGKATASFGPGPEMQVPGRVAAWEPPNRIVFEGGGGDDDGNGMAFEWLVEARDGGTCVVRLVNTGFGSGESGDDQYDAMTEGWKLFLFNLRLHLQHFAGQTAVSFLPSAMWSGTREDAWRNLTSALGVEPAPAVGADVQLTGGSGLSMSGTVTDRSATRLSLLLREPAPGTAIVAVEGTPPQIMVSIWAYLYGENAPVLATDQGPQWQQWLTDRADGIPPD